MVYPPPWRSNGRLPRSPRGRRATVAHRVVVAHQLAHQAAHDVHRMADRHLWARLLDNEHGRKGPIRLHHAQRVPRQPIHAQGLHFAADACRELPQEVLESLHGLAASIDDCQPPHETAAMAEFVDSAAQPLRVALGRARHVDERWAIGKLQGTCDTVAGADIVQVQCVTRSRADTHRLEQQLTVLESAKPPEPRTLSRAKIDAMDARASAVVHGCTGHCGVSSPVELLRCTRTRRVPGTSKLLRRHGGRLEREWAQ